MFQTDFVNCFFVLGDDFTGNGAVKQPWGMWIKLTDTNPQHSTTTHETWAHFLGCFFAHPLVFNGLYLRYFQTLLFVHKNHHQTDINETLVDYYTSVVKFVAVTNIKLGAFKIFVRVSQSKHTHLWNLIVDTYPIMQSFVTEMCTHVHISVTKCCIAGYGTGALWDLRERSVIYRARALLLLLRFRAVKFTLILQRYFTSTGVSTLQYHRNKA